MNLDIFRGGKFLKKLWFSLMFVLLNVSSSRCKFPLELMRNSERHHFSFITLLEIRAGSDRSSDFSNFGFRSRTDRARVLKIQNGRHKTQNTRDKAGSLILDSYSKLMRGFPVSRVSTKGIDRGYRATVDHEHH